MNKKERKVDVLKFLLKKEQDLGNIQSLIVNCNQSVVR